MIKELDPSDMSPLFEDSPIPMPTGVFRNKEKLSPQEAFLQTIKTFVPLGIGVALIFFGITSTGSYYSQISRFGGILASIFYTWQLGTLMAMVGSILVYDTLKKSGYL